jgi:hypothetical protein
VLTLKPVGAGGPAQLAASAYWLQGKHNRPLAYCPFFYLP